jgi:hypothetical protein
MKRLAGQAGRTLGWVLHHTGMIAITVFFLLALAVGGFAFRLAAGPIQIPWLSSRLASVVSGQGIDVHIDQAALAWGGYRAGGAVPLYLRLRGITVRNAAGGGLATIRDGKLVFFPSALLGGRAPILVFSNDTLFEGSDVKVAMQAAIELGGFFKFAHADIAVTLGAGALGAAGQALPISGGGFEVAVTPRAVDLTHGILNLAPRGNSRPVLGVSGAGRLTDLWRGHVTLTADALAADDLAAYWPPGLLVQTRDWVTGNITAGTARDAKFTIGLSAPKTLAGLSLQSAAGSFTGSGLSIDWIPHAPLITGVAGTLTLTDDDDIDIKADTGTLAGLSLAGGTMHITGLMRPTQVGNFNLPVSGKVADALALLNAPPLNLLKTAPPQLLTATGFLTGTVAATMPLRGDVTLPQVDLRVATALTEVTVATPVDGVDLTGGALSVTATGHDLQVNGAASLAGQNAAIATTVTFAAGPPVIDFTLAGNAGNALLQQFGIAADAGDADGIAGTVPFSVHVAQTSDGKNSATLRADLTPSAIFVPALGWSKKAGAAGHVNVQAALNGETLAGITSIDATAPALDIQAVADPGHTGRLNFSDLKIGASAGQGSITAPATATKPWQVAFSGKTLDITAILNPPPAKPAKPPARSAKPPSGPLWAAQLRFQTFVLAGHGAPALRDLVFAGTGQGDTVLTANASAAGPAGGVTVAVAPAAGKLHPQTVQVHTGDGGFLLRALGAYSNIAGGTLDLTATARDDGTHGTANFQKFRLLQAPGFTKVLETMTIYGAAAAASGPGLEFDHLVAPFAIVQHVLTLKGARAYSSSLGFTASGTIDLVSGDTNLSTTIVPAYAINALPGKIPVVGKLFSAEQGGGLFAIRAKISGKLTAPDVTVNPLSALTPGVLRDVFGTAQGTK